MLEYKKNGWYKMIHLMKLKEMPFSEIEKDKKTVELRLLDEKRQRISPGDTILFTHNDDVLRRIFCRVTSLHFYPDFSTLYREITVLEYGLSGADMSIYYSPCEIEKYGVVGIRFVKDEVKNRLYSMADGEYRKFSASLLPTLDKDKLLGVRIPLLRKMAKEIKKQGLDKSFMSEEHEYFEENALHAFLIEDIADFDECINELEEFLPRVDNWSVCDSMNPKCFKKHRSELLEYAKKWIGSEHSYTVRFGIKTLMCHYLDDEFSSEYPALIAEVKSEEYYVNMMRAWYFATALSKRWEDIIQFVEKGVLDKWTHNKTIQKARESYRITKEQKEYLRALKEHNG